jgi:heat shock protein HslJ
MKIVQRRRSFCLGLGLAVAGIATGGCDQSPTSPSEIVGQTWRLVAIDRSGLPSISAPADRNFTVEFQDGGRLGVRADCNSCSGSFELSESQLTIRPLACTRAFCGNDSLDTLFLQALSEARTVRIEGGELVIRAESVTLRFRRQ